MTTIVWRDGVLAGDSRAYSKAKHALGRKHKIHRLKDGSLFGASSSAIGCPEALRRAVEENGIDVTYSEAYAAQGILVRPNGDVHYFNDQDGWTGAIEVDYIAIGSGEEYAMGAMAMGADAVRALEVAIEMDVWTGGVIDTLSLETVAKSRKRKSPK